MDCALGNCVLSFAGLSSKLALAIPAGEMEKRQVPLPCGM